MHDKMFKIAKSSLSRMNKEKQFNSNLSAIDEGNVFSTIRNKYLNQDKSDERVQNTMPCPLNPVNIAYPPIITEISKKCQEEKSKEIS